MTDPAVKERLIAFLGDLDLDLDVQLNGDTPLTASGVLDSLLLLQLAMWVEQEVGRQLNPAEFDLMEEWRSVDSVVGFVVGHRREP